jgi:RNA polymerase-binding transcription factor DksA
MHYHYFTLEQRHALERTIRQRMSEPGMETMLETLRTPEFGVCESCGSDIPYVKLIGNPALRRCPDCFRAKAQR